jgi:Kef-type K+ transport system membrane component KefB/Trk K+ transport system NAD-binding subunit
MIESVFIELSTIIIIAVVVSGAMKLLKQPLIIGYIITGIIAGPLLLNIVRSTDMVAIFSQLGIVFLLFIAGLSLNPKLMKKVGKVSIITGAGQVLFTTLVGFFIAKSFGFSDIAALYIAIALTFSSTIIIVKLLSDKGDLQTLYGRISLGFLIVQDIVAIIILMVISSSIGGFDILSITTEALLIGAGLLAFVALFSIFALPKIMKVAAKSQEFLLIFSVGWLLLLAVIFGYLNFSIEIGALLAGVILSVSPYHHEIKSKMNVLRDFFILFFFVLLGSQMIFMNVSEFLLPIAVFSIFILVGNPLIVMILMGSLKYTKRNGFLAGLTVAQISEFSLILVALGVKVGHVSTEILSMVTAIGLMTILGSTYTITHADKLYSRISKYLGIFERGGRKIDEHIYHRGEHYDIILFGCNRIGFSMLESVKNLKKKILIIDYDPEIITDLAKKGYECKYGDVDDMELLNELNFSGAKMIISTIPDIETNSLLMKKVRERNKKAIIIIVSHQIKEALKLYENGATYVVMPYFLGGQHASTLIQRHRLNLNKFLREKAKHMKHLKTREKLKHEHPKAEKHR